MLGIPSRGHGRVIPSPCRSIRRSNRRGISWRLDDSHGLERLGQCGHFSQKKRRHIAHDGLHGRSLAVFRWRDAHDAFGQGYRLVSGGHVVEYNDIMDQGLGVAIAKVLEVLIQGPNVLFESGWRHRRVSLVEDTPVEFSTIGYRDNRKGLSELVEGRQGEVGRRR